MFPSLPRPGRPFRRSSPAAAILPLALGLLLTPFSLDAGWQEGVAAFQTGDFETALKEFREVTEAQPEFAGGHLMAAQTLSRLGRWSEAAAAFARAYELEPEAKPDLVIPWGRALLESNQPEKAVTVLEKLDPDGLDETRKRAYFVLLSRALMASGGPARSIERLDRLARQAPDNPVVWQALGHALARADRPAEAAEAFERVLELAEDEAPALRSYIQVTFETARRGDGETRREWYERAADAAERLVRHEPTGDHWLLLGEARLGAGQHRQAVAAFEKAAVKEPKDPLPDYYLGEAFLGLREGARAEWVLRDALRKRPGPDLTKRIHLALGQAHHLEEEYAQAARDYRAAGDEERAALMEEYQRLAEINDRIEREQDLCREQLARMEALMADSRDLEGTAEWRQLESEVARLREACG